MEHIVVKYIPFVAFVVFFGMEVYKHIVTLIFSRGIVHYLHAVKPYVLQVKHIIGGLLDAVDKHHYIGRVIERDSSVGGIIIEIRQVAEHLSSRRFAFAHIAGNGYELFVPDLLYIACLDNYVFEVYRQ